MKALRMMLLVLCFTLILSATSYSLTIDGGILFGNSWGGGFTTDWHSNLVYLWTTNPFFEKATGLPSGWQAYISPAGNFEQLYTYGIAPQPNILFSQWWNDPQKPVYIDWMEIQYNWATHEVIQIWQGGGLYSNGNWAVVSYGSAGGPSSPPSPVPEPVSIMLLGVGLVGIAIARKKLGK
jgi:hypothetical protein